LNYPAEHYIVILWGHGDGHSVAWDYNPTDALTIKELAHAFRNPPQGYKLGVDIVGFNSCSLGTIEVYQELHGLVDFGIASEGFTPKTSWPYDRILAALNVALENDPQKMTVRRFAQTIVDEYMSCYRASVIRSKELQQIQRKAQRLGAALDLNKRPDLLKSSWDLTKPSPDLTKPSPDLTKPSPDLAAQYGQHMGGIDLSICDLQKSPSVTAAMKELVDKLTEEMHKPSYDVFAAILGAHAISQSYFNKDFTDLFDFCRALWSFCPRLLIQAACEGVMKAIRSMCEDPGRFGDDVRNSNGVSIFFPWSDCGEWGEKEVTARYKDLDFTAETGWDKFLEEYRNLAHDLETGKGHFAP
jgi:hypothetical protein